MEQRSFQMKCNKFLVKGIFTAALSFGFVLTACDTGNGNNPTPEELAAKLVADLNAIEAGCATVNDATVKITSGTYVLIPSTLTVPEDVTLDVTADDAGLLLGSQDVGNSSVTLTVNGTIISGPGQVRMEDCQGDATINGSGTIRLNSKGRLLDVSGNFNTEVKIILDGVTLVGLEGNNEALIYVDKGGELIMKNGVITGNGDWGVVIQEGGTMTNPYDNDNIVTFEGGIFTMEGGTIIGNSGGGVKICKVGGSYTFTVEDGGLVTVTNDLTKGKGTFTMNSPAVMGTSGNISGNTDNVYNDGGTVNGTANPNPDNINSGMLW
jgi:hypothetical protein